MEFDPSKIEAKWQQKWEEAKIFEIDLKKAKNPYYSLVMFPYPSGDKLHVGHWYNFAPADSAARFMRMKGNDVMTPMGFDAFGLPAENYAIKSGIHPDTSTRSNVQTMVKQLRRMGCMYDWSKMVNTSTPEYYRWTQWLFLQMYEHKLAYKKEAPVNFCPSCQTVLANEQAQDGTCERCGTTVIQKNLSQWFWKITDYAERLLQGLGDLDWPEKTKIMQQNWIGRKHGINIAYDVEGTKEKIVCFTTRPDTNFGATFVVLAPEHPFAMKVMDRQIVPNTGEDRSKHVRWYYEQSLKKTELERQEEGRKKTGEFTGFYAINQLTGYRMPVWVSDFVLGGFGTGAVVGVPGHDVRDFEFAQQFKIPVIRVVVASDGDASPIERIEQVQEEEGTMINSQFLDGLNIHEATKRIMSYMEDKGIGQIVTTYRIRDWLVSRQRYWGAPIPIVYDPDGKPHPVPEKHLPWLLPTDVAFKPTGKSPLTESKEFIERTEKLFGKGWTPEFDTMDTFVCSSYYYLRYLAEGDEKHLVDPTIEKRWMPVSTYIGGPEHACMHLIYARFVMMALKDFGFVSHEEPFKKLVHQGLITNKGAKMSKSKGNVVSPDSLVEWHGSDAFRMYLMFMGPFTEGGDWSDTGIKGIDRFVKRIHAMCTSNVNKKVDQPEVIAALHRTIKKVTEDIEGLRFNTAISALMELLNLLEQEGGVSSETAKTFTLLLAPLAPHLSEELWESLGGKDFVIRQKWPVFDPALIKTSTFVIAIQVNGKLRGEIEVDAGAPKEEVLAKAKAHPNVQKFLASRVKKEIYVAGKLVSLVV
ncbi:MAG: leucine--tRNA ligase [Candidatus Peribacter sp.]|nr:leucine--tRNA ligase [Candidatus Peribacter sp.]